MFHVEMPEQSLFRVTIIFAVLYRAFHFWHSLLVLAFFIAHDLQRSGYFAFECPLGRDLPQSAHFFVLNPVFDFLKSSIDISSPVYGE